MFCLCNLLASYLLELISSISSHFDTSMCVFIAIGLIGQVTMEKNELKEENGSLETQIEKLQGEIQAKMAQSKPDLNVPPQLVLEQPELTKFPGHGFQMPTIEPTLPQGPAVLVVPFRPDLQAAFPAPNVTELTPKPAPVISKPHARYPTPADSWPSQLLGEQPTSNL
jgi:hypothetical protein